MFSLVVISTDAITPKLKVGHKTYIFKFKTGDGKQQRMESLGSDGIITGNWIFTDENGKIKQVKWYDKS